MKNNLFKDKRVLITGHTGFKGSWLALWLCQLGAKVTGVSFNVPTSPANHEIINNHKHIDEHYVNVNNFEEISNLIRIINPDFVFHLAAQSLVSVSYDKPRETLITNAIGTVNILESLRLINKNIVAIIITSDKVYDNVEWIWGYRENDRIGGKDPYSASKGMAELAIRSYTESFYKSKDSNIRLAVTRAGNVIGGGDWGKDRIVPDCMAAWSNNVNVEIRNPESTRPWQHVIEPLSGYLALATDLYKYPRYHGEAINFGPDTNQNYSVLDLIIEMKKHWDNVRWRDVSEGKKSINEAGLLKLNCDKALSTLSWRPTLNFRETVKLTVEWYKAYYSHKNLDVRNLSIQQINDFTKLAHKKQNTWIDYD